ncbi:YihY/virulence factor BrkB family protein [Calycomorphotria hydatis]|uniref:Uncharacterized protein n=1 Tax=Calycomorphotria hydatis TaxID=2528027 RepID=A0A517T8D6_9PLAN|nr:YihY/virulence factor BrkB family protein [Calycomorphotria hydatis]QDT64631.1 hypothetical protein V22_18710 [Calycomorphotria hydatis]
MDIGKRDFDTVSLKELWLLGGMNPWQLLKQSVVGFAAHGLFDRSAQFAYYAALSIAPLLIVIVFTAARIGSQDLTGALLLAAENTLPPEAYSLVEAEIHTILSATSTNWIIGMFGVLFVAISGRQIFLTIGSGIDDAYDVDRHRYVRRNLIAIAVTYGTLLLAMIAVGMLSIGPRVTSWIFPGEHGSILNVLTSWSVSCFFLLAATSLIYSAIPSANVRWYPISPGSMFFTLSWIGLTQCFRFYVETFGNYSKTYGALAGVVLLLTWLYFTGALLLAGGQINSVIHRAAVNRMRRETETDQPPEPEVKEKPEAEAKTNPEQVAKV